MILFFRYIFINDYRVTRNSKVAKLITYSLFVWLNCPIKNESNERKYSRIRSRSLYISFDSPFIPPDRFHLAAFDFILASHNYQLSSIRGRFSLPCMRVVLIVDYSMSQRQPETKNTGVKYRFAMAETFVVSGVECNFRHVYWTGPFSQSALVWSLKRMRYQCEFVCT